MYKIFFFISFVWSFMTQAQTAFDYPPINYPTVTANNEIETLKRRIANSSNLLKYDNKFGYLPAILKELGIEHSSQSLVFSKTSFQRELISAKTPRALYFNQNTYIGWIPNSDVLEIMSNDPELGAIFYTLEQKPLEKPIIVRNDHDCLDCHSSARTQSVPGGMLKSRFINNEGSLMSKVVNHRTSLKDRWGSWYVTGESRADEHLGNFRTADEKLNNNSITDLSKLFDVNQYLIDSSDIVALMVMEHQIHMTNLITRAGYRTRITLDKAGILPNETENIGTEELDEISRQLNPLIKYMLFIEEAKINGPIKGNTNFTNYFNKTAPTDAKGRALSQLNLKTKLFEYPLSYMIYSPNISELPAIAKKILFNSLRKILTEKVTNDITGVP